MALDTSKECGICNEEFSEEENSPRMLPCFDCLCSACINQLIATNNKFCPFCRKSFNAKTAEDFRINTNLLHLLKYVNELETGKITPNKGRNTSYAVWKKDFRKKFSKQNLTDCQNARAEIESAIETNLELKEEIFKTNRTIKDEILKRLEEIKTRNGKQMKDLDEENERLKSQLKIIVEQEMEINEADAKLEAAVNFALAAPVMDRTADITDRLQKSLKDLESFISRDEVKRHIVMKEVERTRCKISVIQDVLTSSEEGEDDVINHSSIMAAMTLVEDATLHISVNALRRMSGPVGELVRNGKVMAVKEMGGRRRYARITVTEEDQLFLHHLEDMPTLPTNVHLIKYDDVMRMVDMSCRWTFLELGVGGRSLGRLLIRLFNNDILHNHFSILITGETGPSYAHSNIFKVYHKDHSHFEQVWMGDYEKNDGSGGKAIVEGIEWAREGKSEIYKRPWVKGTVKGLGLFPIKEGKVSQFGIFTRDNPGCLLEGSLGIVESGLNVLTEAISNHPGVKNIKVMDCGIVLSQ